MAYCLSLIAYCSSAGASGAFTPGIDPIVVISSAMYLSSSSLDLLRSSATEGPSLSWEKSARSLACDELPECSIRMRMACIAVAAGVFGLVAMVSSFSTRRSLQDATPSGFFLRMRRVADAIGGREVRLRLGVEFGLVMAFGLCCGSVKG